MRAVASIIGLFLWALAGSMILPIIVDPDDWHPFAIAAGLTVLAGGMLFFSNWGGSYEINVKRAYLLTAGAWLVLPVFGALPFELSGFSATDAIFETVSGMTTTGSTIMNDLDHQPPALLFWRALLQWIGGIGVIVMSIAILPFLGVGGMQLFRTESSDQSDKELPRAAKFAGATVWVYGSISSACAVAYMAAGMDGFDAVTHAMSTVSTGGFSNYDASMAHFTNPAIHWLATLFMLASGIPLVLYIRAVRGNTVRSTQVKSLLIMLGIAITALFAWRIFHSDRPAFEVLTQVAFNVVSIVTTTGYALTDYTLWGGFAATVFFFLTFCGACTGSTSGGLKVMRFTVALKSISIQLRKMIYVHGVFVEKYEGKPLAPEVMHSVGVFFFVFFVFFFLEFLALYCTGLDMVTSLSGAATSLANVGPGLGSTIGPAGTFASLPETAKWILCLGMVAGRLEFMTLLVLVLPAFWRR